MTASRAAEPASAPAVVGVDGGNSKTDVVVGADDGSLLGWARGGCGNHQMVGLERALDEIGQTIEEALGRAGRPQVAAFCLAGLDLPADEERLEPALAERAWGERLTLHNDTLAVMRAGARAGWGLGVVCGAGLNCAGLGPDGASVRFPALGELSGDFAQGGSWLGTRGLGLALRAGDGRGKPTALRQAVAEHLGVATPEEALDALYVGRLGFDRLAGLAKVVLDTAAAGDEVARQAADQLADEVVAMATAALRRLEVTDQVVEVVLGGGIFATSDRGFHGRVRAGILEVARKAAVTALGAPPVLGAALLGLDALGLGGEAEDRLRAEVAASPLATPRSEERA